MKQSVTLTLERDYVSYLGQMARETQRRRSVVAEQIIGEYLGHLRQAQLAGRAGKFLAQPEGPEDTSERADWEALDLELCHER